MAPACAPSKVAFRQALIGVEKQQHELSCRGTTCHALSVSFHTTHEKLLRNSDTQSVHDTDRVQSTTTHLGRAPGKMSALFHPNLSHAVCNQEFHRIRAAEERRKDIVFITGDWLSPPFDRVTPFAGGCIGIVSYVRLFCLSAA